MNKKGNRLTYDMDADGMLIAMWDGNIGALQCMMEMIEADQKKGMDDIRFLDSLEIYGEKINTIWSVCCNCNMKKFRKTIKVKKEQLLQIEKFHQKKHKK